MNIPKCLIRPAINMHRWIETQKKGVLVQECNHDPRRSTGFHRQNRLRCSKMRWVRVVEGRQENIVMKKQGKSNAPIDPW